MLRTNAALDSVSTSLHV